MDIMRSFEKDKQEHTPSRGKLYVVATPIGNLEDITFRAVRVLKEVDLIAAEDTRQTRKLLSHYDIKTRLVSYHEHNKQSSGPELIKRLTNGETVALVSDAGTPAISDPGEDLVRLAIEAGIAVVPIPGASASISALVASGLSTASFRFIGFLPREKKKLRIELDRLAAEKATLIIYEAPHRLLATLQAMLDCWGDRRIAMIRELTKRYEEAARGTLQEAIAYLEHHPPKGEYVLVVEGGTGEAGEQSDTWWESLSAAEHVRHYEEQQLPRKEAMKKAALDRGISKRDLYQQWLQG